MHALRFLTIYLLVAIGAAALFAAGPLAFVLPLVVFGLIPLLELALPGTTENLTPEEEEAARGDRVYEALLYAAVPTIYAFLALFLWRVDAGALGPLGILGGAATTGIVLASLGINVGHELGHRAEALPRWTSRLLYLPSLYVHFFVEHNRGHHVRVATDDDPASARRGEWLYTFWLRSLAGGLRSAWDLEATRLRRSGGRPWSLRNEVLVGLLVQGAAVLAVFALLGPVVGAAWLGAALVAVLVLETVNYVEHYGLRRQTTARGRPERVQPHHSWNANHSIGRALLFDLTRHSDHHAHPRRKGIVLRHFDEAPQLPTGYPGMMVLATLPPLFHLLMERELDRVQGPAAETVAA